MVQIISDKTSNYVNWFAEVIDRLGEYPDISRIVVFASTERDENKSQTQIIDFMNCDYDDIYYIGSLLQKEAIKHEMAEDYGLNDDEYEFEIDEEDD